MATQIKKTGAFPAVSVIYEKTYTISDIVVGKFISLSGAKKFYNPGIGLTLQSPSSGTTTVTVPDTVTLTTFAFPSGPNSITIGASINDTFSFPLTVKAYLNYLINGSNGGTAIQTLVIAAGQSSINITISSFTPTNQITNITPVITNILNGTTTLDWDYGTTNATATINTTSTQTVPVAGAFTNTLNIPAFKISSINFYGADRDTLILKASKLTS